jgi:hypothetical protein
LPLWHKFAWILFYHKKRIIQPLRAIPTQEVNHRGRRFDQIHPQKQGSGMTLSAPIPPPLQWSDVAISMPPPARSLGPETAEFLKRFLRDGHERHIAELNEQLSSFQKLWPQGRPVEMYVAFELCEFERDVMLKKLCDPSFIRVVLTETEGRGYGRTNAGVPLDTAAESRPKGKKSISDRARMLRQDFTKEWTQPNPPKEPSPVVAAGYPSLTFVGEGGKRATVGGWLP